ncbi:MAG: hypothetical protein RJA15_849, partial [Actinomycetota bacterium]
RPGQLVRLALRRGPARHPCRSAHHAHRPQTLQIDDVGRARRLLLRNRRCRNRYGANRFARHHFDVLRLAGVLVLAARSRAAFRSGL